LQQGPAKFGLKSAISIAATASLRAVSSLSAALYWSDNLLNLINKKPSFGICATVLGRFAREDLPRD
jgi:hypothetical protein